MGRTSNKLQQKVFHVHSAQEGPLMHQNKIGQYRPMTKVRKIDIFKMAAIRQVGGLKIDEGVILDTTNVL